MKNGQSAALSLSNNQLQVILTGGNLEMDV